MPPLYDYHCNDCDKIEERYASMDEDILECDCGGRMHRIFCGRYYINGGIDVVTDDITGEPMRFTDSKKMERFCKDRGITPKVGKGWK